MSGSAGRSLSSNSKQENNISTAYALNFLKECADHVAGLDAPIDKITSSPIQTLNLGTTSENLPKAIDQVEHRPHIALI